MISTWNRILYGVLAVLLTAVSVLSCSKTGRYDVVSGEVKSPLVVVAGGETTKAPVTGTTPSSFGIMVVDHQDVQNAASFASYQDYYRNVAVSARGGSLPDTTWTYRYDGYSTPFQRFFLIQKKDGLENPVNADVYAYAPFIGNLSPSDLSAIPFVFENQQDLMWAEQNKSDFSFPVLVAEQYQNASETAKYNNRNIDIDGTHKYVQFNFKHTLALLCFKFKLKNKEHPYAGGSSTYNPGHLSRIKMTAKTGTVYLNGSLNALTGALTTSTLNSSEYSYTQGSSGRSLVDLPSDGSYSNPVYILIAPRGGIADNDYVFDFEFYMQEKGFLPHSTYSMKTADIGGTEIEGAKQYIFEFTLDNYVHFDGATVTDWTNETIEYGI